MQVSIIGRREFRKLASQIQDGGEKNDRGGYKLGQAYLMAGGNRIYLPGKCLVPDRFEAQNVSFEEEVIGNLRKVPSLIGGHQ